MTLIALIGARGIPKNFEGTSGLDSYVEQQIDLLTPKNKVTCYVHRWANTTNCQTFHGAKILSIPTINTTYLDTLIYSLISSIHASFSDVEIIWFHGFGSAFFSFIPAILHKKVYITIHTREWERKKWSTPAKFFLKICERIALSYASKVHVVSNNLLNYYTQIGTRNVFLQKFQVTKKSKVKANGILKRYNLKKNNYILYVGRFVSEKRIEWLIKASQFITMPIVLVGGSSHSDDYVRELKQLAEDTNIIFTGYLFNEEKDELISNAKLFVLPSQTEGLPISVIEANQLETPCLIGDFLRGEFKKINKIRYFRTYDYDSFAHNLIRGIRSHK